MIATLAFVFLGSGVLIFLVSLPLVYRKIGMNHFYGIRIARAFQSPQLWYDINAYGGRQFARWSLLLMAFGATGMRLPEEHLFGYTLAGVAIVFVATLAPVMQILIWSRKQAAAR